MIEKIHIFDDIIDKKEQNKIEEELLGRHFSWFFLDDVSKIKNDKQQRHAFSHYFIENGKINSDKLDIIKNIPINACSKIKFQIKGVSMVRSFLQLPLSNNLLTKELDTPHVDSYEEHLVVLYYVSDSDGDTVIFKNEFKKNSQIEEQKFIELKRISPKKGRVVLFNGKLYHTANQPQKKVRTIVNFNLL